MQKLSDIAMVFSGYTFRDSMDTGSDGQLHVIQPKNLRSLNEAPLVAFFSKYERYLLQNDDILVNIKGANNHVTLLAIPQHKDYVCNSAFAVVRVNSQNADAKFLAWYLQLDDTQSQLQLFQAKTTVPNLSIKEIQTLKVPSLPLARQRAIGALALSETKRASLVLEIEAKRKLLLDHDLMMILKKGSSFE